MVTRMTANTVVINARENMPIRAAFLLNDIWTPHSMLIGSAITIATKISID